MLELHGCLCIRTLKHLQPDKYVFSRFVQTDGIFCFIDVHRFDIYVCIFAKRFSSAQNTFLSTIIMLAVGCLLYNIQISELKLKLLVKKSDISV